MTDIVERLRGGWNHDRNPEVDMAEAADRISELERELAAETNNKQEFERDWLECCNRLNDERIANREEESVLNGKLAAAQAREKVQMMAIESLVENIDRPPDANCSCHISPPCSDCVDYGGLREAFEWVDRALTKPSDDTALRAALKAERERIASLILDIDTGAMDAYQVSEAIRALEDE